MQIEAARWRWLFGLAIAIAATPMFAAEIGQALRAPTDRARFDLRVVVAPPDGGEIVGWVVATDAYDGSPVPDMPLRVALAKGRYGTTLEDLVERQVTTGPGGQATFRFDPPLVGGNLWVEASTEHGGRLRSAAASLGFQYPPATAAKRRQRTTVEIPGKVLVDALQAGLDNLPGGLAGLAEHAWTDSLDEPPNFAVEVDGRALTPRSLAEPEPDDGELIVTANANAYVVHAGEPWSIDVTAQIAAGVPAADASVTINNPYRGLHLTARTDEQGRAHIDLSPPELASLRPIQGKQYHDGDLEVSVQERSGKRSGTTAVPLRTAHHPILLLARTDDVLGTDGPMTLYLGASYADASPADAVVTVTAMGGKTPIVRASTGSEGLARIHISAQQRRRMNAAARLTITAIDQAGRRGEAELGAFWTQVKTVTLTPEKTVLAPGDPLVLDVDAMPPGRAVQVAVLAGGHYVYRREVKTPARLRVPYRTAMTGTVTAFAIATVTPAGYLPHFAARDEAIVVYRHGRGLRLRATHDKVRRGRRTIDWHLSDTRHAGASPDVSDRTVLGIVAIDRRYNSAFGSHKLTSRDWFRDRPSADEVEQSWLETVAALDPDRPAPNGVDALVGLAWTHSEIFSFDRGVDRFVDATWEAVLPDMKAELRPVGAAIHKATGRPSYRDPAHAEDLEALLRDWDIDFASLFDPWGRTYRLSVDFERNQRVARLWSAGFDGQFDTVDDRAVKEVSWPFFARLGERVSAAVEQAFRTQRIFLDDADALAGWLISDGIDWHAERDPSGNPYEVASSTSNGIFRLVIRGRTSPAAEPVVVWHIKLAFGWRYAAELMQAVSATPSLPWPASTADVESWLRETGKNTERWLDPSGHAIELRVIHDANGEAIELWTEPGDSGTYADRPQQIARLNREWPAALQRNKRREAASGSQRADIGNIYLSIFDPYGTMLPGARIEARPAGGHDDSVLTAFSDQGGLGRLLGLDAGMYSFRFSLPGFGVVDYPSVSIRAHRTSALKVTMGPVLPACTIAGVSPPYDSDVFLFPRRLPTPNPGTRALLYIADSTFNRQGWLRTVIDRADDAWDFYGLAATPAGRLAIAKLPPTSAGGRSAKH